MSDEIADDKRKLRVNTSVMIFQRKKKGFTQVELAETAQVGKNSIGDMECGEPVSVKTIRQVHPVLDLTYDQITNLRLSIADLSATSTAELEKATFVWKNEFLLAEIKINQTYPDDQRIRECEKLLKAIASFCGLENNFCSDVLNARGGSTFFRSFCLKTTPKSSSTGTWQAR